MPMYEQTAPTHRWLSEQQVMKIASEIYVENEGFDGELDAPSNIESAIAIIRNSGTITISSEVRVYQRRI